MSEQIRAKNDASTAISFRSVSKRYRKELPLIESISFDLKFGQIAVVAGPSGSGKSTILQMAAGLLIPDTGSVSVNGSQIDRKLVDVSKFRRFLLSYIPQDDYLFETLNVEENVALAYDLHGEKRSPEKIQGTLSRLGIGNLAKRSISEVSAGERRRVSIARGIVRGPRILIIDEPTSALDTEKTIELMKEFRSLSDSGTAVASLIASHDVNELNDFADYIYGIEDCNLVTIKTKI